MSHPAGTTPAPSALAPWALSNDTLPPTLDAVERALAPLHVLASRRHRRLRRRSARRQRPLVRRLVAGLDRDVAALRALTSPERFSPEARALALSLESQRAELYELLMHVPFMELAPGAHAFLHEAIDKLQAVALVRHDLLAPLARLTQDLSSASSARPAVWAVRNAHGELVSISNGPPLPQVLLQDAAWPLPSPLIELSWDGTTLALSLDHALAVSAAPFSPEMVNAAHALAGRPQWALELLETLPHHLLPLVPVVSALHRDLPGPDRLSLLRSHLEGASPELLHAVSVIGTSFTGDLESLVLVARASLVERLSS